MFKASKKKNNSIQAFADTITTNDSTNSNNKKLNKKSNKKDIVNELSEIAKSLNIRVSSPYGYYPEDVDPLLINYIDEINKLKQLNKELSANAEEANKNCEYLKNELTTLKMQISFTEIPDISAEEGFVMLSKVDTITGQNNCEKIPELKSNLKEPTIPISINFEDDLITDTNTNININKPKNNIKLNFKRR